MTLTDIFVSEVIGTAILILLGAGVVANVVLPKNKGFNAGWVVITFGWGLAVYAGVWAAWKSQAHLNPAVTLGLVAAGRASPALPPLSRSCAARIPSSPAR